MVAGATKLIAVDVTPGDEIVDFKGQSWRFKYITNGPISHGKVVVEPLGAKPGDSREFFASVFPDLKIRAEAA